MRPAPIVILLLIVAAVVAVASAPSTSRHDGISRVAEVSTPAPLSNKTFHVGPAQIVVGPKAKGGSDLDSIISGVRVSDTLVRAYIGNQQTRLLQGTNVATLAMVDPDHVVIDGSKENGIDPDGGEPVGSAANPDDDPNSKFDRCGAWMKGAYRDLKNPDLIRGWYHAENHCNYGIDPEAVPCPGGVPSPCTQQTHRSTAYAESYDGGKTFKKVPVLSFNSGWTGAMGWPNNQVVTSPDFPTLADHTGFISGAGNATIFRRSGYYYMYFENVVKVTKKDGTTDNRKLTTVARATVASGGVPGTWKGYTGTVDGKATWDTDGIGGTFAPLPVTGGGGSTPGTSASVDRGSNTVMLARQIESVGLTGIQMSTSADGVSFTTLDKPLVPVHPTDFEGAWDATTGDRFRYVSILGGSGEHAWRDSFYLFYVYIPEGQPASQRYLIRRKVTVVDSPDKQLHTFVALSRHVGRRADTRWDRWDTAGVAAARSTEKYRASTAHGYIATTQLAGTKALIDCYTPWGDNFPEVNCAPSDASAGKPRRVIGYIWNRNLPRPRGTKPLFRCWTGTGRQADNYVTTVVSFRLKSCAGGGRLGRLVGYVKPVPA